MKLIVCKRVPIFVVNPNTEVVCVDEDKRENEVFAIVQENREKAIELIEMINRIENEKESKL
jgi:hypothetical protein